MGRGRRSLGLGLLGVLAVTGCNGITVDSRWRDRDVLIDGDATEWYNATTYFDSEKVAFGVMNDGSHLYLALTSADRGTQMQVLTRGFTVWFDPGGGKADAVGIRFPVEPAEGRRGPRGMPGGDGPDMETLVANLDAGDPALEILTGDTVRRTTLLQEPEVAVVLGEVNGALIYELRVPLHGESVSVGADPGAVITIRLETAAPPPRPEDGLRRPPGGDDGYGDRGDLPPPGGPGMGMPGSAEPPPSLDVEAKVTLAPAP